MARDEALLDAVVAAGATAPPLTLRRTAWSGPATTLGRFQPFATFEVDGTPVPSVRRITGGGAISHGRDLTVAAIAPTPSLHFPDRTPLALATRAAETLIGALAARAIEVRVRGGESDERSQQTIVDCFERASPFDLVIGAADAPVKVGGLALYRREGFVLVQGSLLREELGLDEENDEALFAAWATVLGVDGVASDEFSGEEETRAAELARERYGREAWNRRR